MTLIPKRSKDTKSISINLNQSKSIQSNEKQSESIRIKQTPAKFIQFQAKCIKIDYKINPTQSKLINTNQIEAELTKVSQKKGITDNQLRAKSMTINKNA